ncbi:uncharacterized protein J4E87_004271 [Alternaria ethzedia]|uniref:uncharacterized protein n=1 Tax=Alternaria ethzedia TaxID=181014 RepID=UPI0020C1BA76|nr:uncharacterized protein J4E87_004271 [Alternaria ethzedia]KAI4626930.1 hypothetical protein J4E87_004271 [Alternaria ethzedia]
MSAPILPVYPQWVAQTLTPYLRYAFKHLLRDDLDIEPYVQRALETSSFQPKSSTDGDDLFFERVFFAIERRHQGLPAELNGLTDNLQPLARFLIRRAQLKGPYELLHRNAQPSEAWKKYESVRLTQIATETARVQNYSSSSVDNQPGTSTFAMTARPPANHDIDPRLLYANPGDFTEPGLSGTLTIPELQHYQRRNQEIEAFWARRQGQLPNQQQGFGLQHPSPGSQGSLQGRQHEMMSPIWQRQFDDNVNGPGLPYVPRPALQQHSTPDYVQQVGQQRSVGPSQLPTPAPTPTAQMYAPAQSIQQYSPQLGSYQPTGYSSLAQPQYLQPRQARTAPELKIKQHSFPTAPRSQPTQSGNSANRRRNTQHGLPTLARPAGISKSVSQPLATTATPDWTDTAQLAASMPAFKSLPKAEKVAKILEINRAIKAKNPTTLTAMDQFLLDHGVAKEDVTVVGVVGPDGNIVKPPGQQAITVPAPGYPTHPGVHATPPGMPAFAHHPGYSNITSSFPQPSYNPPTKSAPAGKRGRKKKEKK